LRRLARRGAVHRVAEGGPARGARAPGRRRTVYEITLEGEELFARALEESAASVDTENFSLKLAFFRYLQPDTRLALLERRRAYLQEKLAQFKANLRTYRERMDAYALSLQRHDMRMTETDIEWIDELITRERAPEGGRARATKA
jgi:hypothetical protein